MVPPPPKKIHHIHQKDYSSWMMDSGESSTTDASVSRGSPWYQATWIQYHDGWYHDGMLPFVVPLAESPELGDFVRWGWNCYFSKPAHLWECPNEDGLCECNYIPYSGIKWQRSLRRGDSEKVGPQHERLYRHPVGRTAWQVHRDPMKACPKLHLWTPRAKETGVKLVKHASAMAADVAANNTAASVTPIVLPTTHQAGLKPPLGSLDVLPWTVEFFFRFERPDLFPASGGSIPAVFTDANLKLLPLVGQFPHFYIGLML